MPKIKYCTLCRKESEKFTHIKLEEKNYWLCSEKCINDYRQNIWRNKEDRERDVKVPQETEEFPDY